MTINWIDVAQQLQTISQAGLTYCKNEYDLERYKELKEIVKNIISNYAKKDFNTIVTFIDNEKGYLTPKVDIRAVVFENHKILMVQEKIDQKWSLPGGWADVGHSPFQNAAKEVYEEAGINVKPVKLFAVYDKNMHNHPRDYHHVYKLFILCSYLSGDNRPGLETIDVKYFGKDELPDLSLQRNTREQILKMFEFKDNPEKEAECD